MSRKRNEGLTVVVLAGAVARGPFEAGALTELLPQVLDDLSNVVFLGTSAGAINAALWARFAALKDLQKVGEQVEGVWRSIDYGDVFGPLTTTGLVDGFELWRGLLTGKGSPSLLDTSPLRKTIEERLHPADIAGNIASGSVRGVGVVATACGKDVAGSRSHLFLQAAPTLKLEPSSPDSSIDIYPTALTVDHILASSAVPVFFPPVRMEVNGVSQAYVDGGVRLNTPISPAITMNAKRVLVVSSHTAHYAKDAPTPEPFGMADALARVLHSVLADGMIEDLRRLSDRNRAVQQVQQQTGGLERPKLTNRQGRELHEIEFMAISPEPGELARVARSALESSERLIDVDRLRYQIMQRLIGSLGAGVGADELLSYVLFDPAYAEAQFKLGSQRARDAIRKGWLTDISS